MYFFDLLNENFIDWATIVRDGLRPIAAIKMRVHGAGENRVNVRWFHFYPKLV